MSKHSHNRPGKIAGAVGSAAVAAALMYANRRREKKKGPTQPGAIPSGEKPETD